jgi:hypothetical protein
MKVCLSPIVLLALSACAKAQTPTLIDQTNIAKEQAEATLCVESGKTREEIDACRAKVKAKYNAIFDAGSAE